MIDCFFSWRDRIIIVTTKAATPSNRPTDILNKPAITNITNETAIKIRMTIVATNGARLPRLSFHRVTNSTEWFFFIMMARKKGAINKIVTTAANNFPQIPGKFS